MRWWKNDAIISSWQICRLYDEVGQVFSDAGVVHDPYVCSKYESCFFGGELWYQIKGLVIIVEGINPLFLRASWKLDMIIHSNRPWSFTYSWHPLTSGPKDLPNVVSIYHGKMTAPNPCRPCGTTFTYICILHMWRSPLKREAIPLPWSMV